jgi:hypothetical protein
MDVSSIAGNVDLARAQAEVSDYHAASTYYESALGQLSRRAGARIEQINGRPACLGPSFPLAGQAAHGQPGRCCCAGTSAP